MASSVSSSAIAGSVQTVPSSSASSSMFGPASLSKKLSSAAGNPGADVLSTRSTSAACKGRIGQVALVHVGASRDVVVRAMASEDETKQGGSDRWAGLAYDMSDDQQDITRGKGMVDTLFQGAVGMGTQHAVLSSLDYISQGQRFLTMDNIKDGYYIAPAFMDKLVVHIAKNFMTLPNIKVPLILGIWGGKGQGKSFQCELVFAKLGINPIMMSAGELESGNAGEPAKLIRQRYREASDIIKKKGKMCCLFINDLDAGAGRMGGTTQYTVNNQMVNATLMNIADNPTNVQLPGVYNKEEIPRVPIIVTGNDFSTLYAPLIRDGRMEKFYWAPTREDRIGVCTGIFRVDNVHEKDVAKLVDAFPGQSIDFFGALRARVYDDEVRKWVSEVGVDSMGKLLVNSKTGPPKFKKPVMTLDKLLEYGQMLVKEQENVKRVKLAEKYLNEAALGDANEDSIKQGTFYGSKQAPAQQKGSIEASKEDVVRNVEEKEIKQEEEEEEKPTIANEQVEEETKAEEERKVEKEQEPITQSLDIVESAVDASIESIATVEPIVEADQTESINVVDETIKVVADENPTPVTESIDVVEPTVNVLESVKVEKVDVVEAPINVVEDESTVDVVEEESTVDVVEEESTVNVVEDASTVNVVEEDSVVNVVEEDSVVNVVEEDSVVNVVEEQKSEQDNAVEATTKVDEDEKSITVTKSSDTSESVTNVVEHQNDTTTTPESVKTVEAAIKDEKKTVKSNVDNAKAKKDAGKELSRQGVTSALRGLLKTVLSILKK